MPDPIHSDASALGHIVDCIEPLRRQMRGKPRAGSPSEELTNLSSCLRQDQQQNPFPCQHSLICLLVCKNLIGSIPFHFLSESYRQSIREKKYLIYIDTLVYFIIKYLLEFSFAERTVLGPES